MQLRCRPNLEDYYPCECPVASIEKTYHYDFAVLCRNVNIDEVEKVFSLTTAADFDWIMLEPGTPSAFLIPEDIFADHRITQTIFVGYLGSGRPTLQIHPKAFRSSWEFTGSFQVMSYDLRILNYEFLAGFIKQLWYIRIRNSKNVNLATLPPLPRLAVLEIIDCTGLNDWTTFPQQAKGLNWISIENIGLYKEDVEMMFPCRYHLNINNEEKHIELKSEKFPIERIQELFNWTGTDFNYVKLEPSSLYIPNNIFANHGCILFELRGNDSNPFQFRPEIHPDAFRSSRNISENVVLESLDMSNFNFSFLFEFQKLKDLNIRNAVNAHLSAFPLLPNINELRLL